RRIPGGGPQVDGQAADTDSQCDQGKLQRYHRRSPEEAQRRDRSDTHDAAHPRRDAPGRSTSSRIRQTYVALTGKKTVAERRWPGVYRVRYAPSRCAAPTALAAVSISDATACGCET